MKLSPSQRLSGFSLLLVALSGCTLTPRIPAPVEERSSGARAVPAAAAASAEPASDAAAEAARVAAISAENANKPGFYTVKPGDTLLRVGLETGQYWRDIARWNSIDNPNVLEVGRVLRVLPPNSDPMQTTAQGVAGSRIESRPLDAKAAPTGASAPVSGTAVAAGASRPTASASAAPSSPSTTAPVAASVPPPPVPKPEGDDAVNWAWPSNGTVLAGFDEVRSKGLVIGGKLGDPVFAAADGRVVYAGSGLRGYGNLLIVKHNPTYLTAYAHNQSLLVKEDQMVRRGQRIAEMGSSDSDRVKLHFEIRRLGKPIDPARLLPAR